jgi:RNA polymerase sigma-70 factor (ECF subfamily)
MPATDDPIPPVTETERTEGLVESGPEPELVEDGAAERARVDLQLLRRAGAGDAQAFAELVERHAKSMYRLAYLLVGTAADAEDVLQETWTGVYKSLKRFEGRSTVRTWLTRILTTQVALWRRKRRGGIISLDESPQAQADALPGRQHSASRNSDWQADLQAALARLTGDHREVIVLREIQGLSYDEMAEALRVPRGTVESRLHRARGELRKLLQAYVP